MSVNEKFSAIRKGLLEFLVLQIIAAERVYVADILRQLSETDFATQEGTLCPLLSKKCAATGFWITNGRSPRPARPANITSLPRRAASNSAKRRSIGEKSMER